MGDGEEKSPITQVKDSLFGNGDYDSIDLFDPEAGL